MSDTLAKFERIVIKGIIYLRDTQPLVRLTPDYFETIQLSRIFGCLSYYYSTHHVIPDLDILLNELKVGFEETEFKNVEAFVSKEEVIEVDKFHYALGEVERAYMTRFLKLNIKTALHHIANGDPKSAQDVLFRTSTENISGQRDVRVIDFVEHFEERKKVIIQRRDTPEVNQHIFIPTGINKLDVELDGGLRKGEMGLWLAPPEGGKSIALQDLSVTAALAGYKTIYFTIEMTAEQVALRMDSRLSQIRYRKFRRAEMTNEDLQEWESKINTLKKDMLKIVSVPEGCSCRLIESELARLSGSFKPDLILADYAGIMAPNEGKFDTSMDWRYIGAVVKNLKGLALKLNIPLWSASQLLVGSKEKVAVSFVDVGLARQQIAAHADVCIAIIQTEQMKALNTRKLQLVKVREGSDTRYLEVASDYDRIKMVAETNVNK